MSVTRLICEKCRFVLVHCQCKKARTPEQRKYQTYDGIHRYTTESEREERRERLKNMKF